MDFTNFPSSILKILENAALLQDAGFDSSSKKNIVNQVNLNTMQLASQMYLCTLAEQSLKEIEMLKKEVADLKAQMSNNK